ncbi:DUF1893 domain-containing protein [Oceanispirochaeta sp.]|uniref:DUF1893 domain-containing protein n=1 Tax=Oceanispirochaeta sp. TaxID=2035350 RepID=UPI002625EB0F|nr:DUF1893 domain-containing protein [Oceanispirochaeta sp.]MDA3958504.1 DUF1893 domain-containing protein [Oceanispirochaeta sp.]
MNLTVTQNSSVVFTHNGHWLHPLFALEDFLTGSDLDASQLYLNDKLIGRGAAVLIHRMGFRRCHGQTLSIRGLTLLKELGIQCSYDLLVDRLDCQTELVLTDDLSLDDAYLELCRRAGRAQ